MMATIERHKNRGGKRTLQYPWAMGLEAREGAIQSSNSFDCDSLAGWDQREAAQDALGLLSVLIGGVKALDSTKPVMYLQ